MAIASAWEIISSSAVLIIFLGIVYAGIVIARGISTQSNTTRKTLSSHGVTYADGKLSVRTDRPAPSRSEYIASTQRAFEKGAKTIGLHPEAFKTGPSREGSVEPLSVEDQVGKSSAVDDQKGFKRTTKLA